MTGRLDRYRGVIPSWEAFLEASRTPEPVTLRVRRGLTDVATVRGRLERRGFRCAPVPGLDDYLRVAAGPHSVAQTLEHWLGLFHVQQSVMALPSLALAPRPGERVLDLCAAPGGKTVHVAELMEDSGCLVAVDPKEKRLRGLMANVFRLGHPNVLVLAADGRELPGGVAFDRVLVDVPCSAEGNYRRQSGRLPERAASFTRYVTRLQEALLRSAVRLVRPGGVVVYSTCTFAPEENEEVVERVLGDAPVRIEPIALDLPHAPGLGSWDGRAYDPALRDAWRVYPHHFDSGGMFMARLRRSEEAAAGPGGWAPVPAAFPGDDPEAARHRIRRLVDILETEYEFSSARLASLGFMIRGANAWVHTAGEWPLPAWPEGEGGRRVVSLGLRAARAAAGGWETPSNAFLSRFARDLGSRRRRSLSAEEITALLVLGSIPSGDLPKGPVALIFEGHVVGRGRVDAEGRLHSEIPKARVKRLRALLRTGGDDV